MISVLRPLLEKMLKDLIQQFMGKLLTGMPSVSSKQVSSGQPSTKKAKNKKVTPKLAPAPPLVQKETVVTPVKGTGKGKSKSSENPVGPTLTGEWLFLSARPG